MHFLTVLALVIIVGSLLAMLVLLSTARMIEAWKNEGWPARILCTLLALITWYYAGLFIWLLWKLIIGAALGLVVFRKHVMR